MVKEGAKPAGIKDIARALGVAIGTVDRALHGRSGVSPVTRGSRAEDGGEPRL